MTLFDKPLDCNQCGQQFTVDDSRLGSLRDGDLEVQYFSCPVCGSKYHILTTDSKMRDLIKRRKAVQMKIKAAHAKRFKERTFKKYLWEYEQIKKEQERMFLELKAKGRKILNTEVASERSENNAAAELHDQS